MVKDEATEKIMYALQQQATSKGRPIQDDGHRREDFRATTD